MDPITLALANKYTAETAEGMGAVKGKDGKDGVSPTVTTTPIDGGTKVTITDASGPHSFDVMDGKDGTGSGGAGEDGATFIPSVSKSGIISWTNDGNLPNPEPVNIKGPDGEDGVGVPPGGAAGQILSKKTAADYDTQWIDAPQGGGGTDLTGGDGVTIKNSVINIDTPVRGILTEAEFNALPESERNSGLYFLEKETTEGGGSSGGGYEEVYSTEERRIGTWIDGKPLYRKTYKTYSPFSKGSWYKISDVPNDMDLLIDLKGGMFIGGSTTLPNARIQLPIPYLESSAAYITIQVRIDGVYMIVAHPGDALCNRSVVFSIEYTKTTDEPEVTI